MWEQVHVSAQGRLGTGIVAELSDRRTCSLLLQPRAGVGAGAGAGAPRRLLGVLRYSHSLRCWISCTKGRGLVGNRRLHIYDYKRLRACVRSSTTSTSSRLSGSAAVAPEKRECAVCCLLLLLCQVSVLQQSQGGASCQTSSRDCRTCGAESRALIVMLQA